MLKPLRFSFCVALAGVFSATAALSAPLFTSTASPLVSEAVSAPAASAPLRFTFVDPALPDAQQLQAAATPAAGSPATPGVFHVFSHGKPGQLLINGQWLKAPEIAAWLRTSLPEGTEHLNLYGCEFAQGEEGQQAVQTLQHLLGLSVAASDDVTGQGGDWDLEVGRPLAALRVEDYAHSLQCVNTTDCDGDGVLNAADLDDENDGILDENESIYISFFDRGNFNSAATTTDPYFWYDPTSPYAGTYTGFPQALGVYSTSIAPAR